MKEYLLNLLRAFLYPIYKKSITEFSVEMFMSDFEEFMEKKSTVEFRKRKLAQQLAQDLLEKGRLNFTSIPSKTGKTLRLKVRIL